MSYDDDWLEEAANLRRQVIRETIRPATLEEVRDLGERCFPSKNDPWFDRYIEFLEHHQNAHFYRAEMPDDRVIAYCRDTEQGVWFLAGIGIGIIQPDNLKILREIVDSLQITAGWP
jgi:hypothetical protein